MICSIQDMQALYGPIQVLYGPIRVLYGTCPIYDVPYIRSYIEDTPFFQQQPAQPAKQAQQTWSYTGPIWSYTGPIWDLSHIGCALYRILHMGYTTFYAWILYRANLPIYMIFLHRIFLYRIQQKSYRKLGIFGTKIPIWICPIHVVLYRIRRLLKV